MDRRRAFRTVNQLLEIVTGDNGRVLAYDRDRNNDERKSRLNRFFERKTLGLEKVSRALRTSKSTGRPAGKKN